jgi:hypothetical protein
MSEKGWTNNVVTLETVRRYEEETREKANGRWRLLYLDGHNSHITLEVIEYTRQNKIVAICLPPHTTHALQPLDVGVFGPFKLALSDEAYKHEMETG